MTPSGFYTAADLSNEAYHSGPGVSNSGLKTIGDRTPAHYWATSPMNPKRRPSEGSRPMFIGTALHAATLEPAKFAEQYVVAEDFKDRRAAGYKAWSAAQSKLILMPTEYENVVGMRESIYQHPVAAMLLRDAYEFEYSAYATDPVTGVLVRMRMDLMTCGGWIVDVKKTQDASDKGIEKTIDNYGYYHQDAFYTDVLEWACGEPPAGFVFIFVEESYPHCVNVKVLDNVDRERGRKMYRQNLTRYAECLAANHWPAYGDDCGVIELSQWARKRIDQRIEERR